jgi:urease accessory protein
VPPTLRPGDGAPLEPEGWSASLDLDFESREGRTRLAHKRQRGPLTVQRTFHPEGSVCHLYLLHPPGGVVGGDRLSIEVRVHEGAHALITTPGAAKYYRSPGPQALVSQRLQIGDAGVLEWFPQENILFPGALLGASTEADMAGNGRFVGWEIHSLGRPVIGERFDHGRADLGVGVHRQGRPLLRERLRLTSGADLAAVSRLRGFPVTATFLASGAQEGDLRAVREALAPPPRDLLFAVTRVEDLLVARCLAQSVESVRRIFVALWGILRPRLLGRPACLPRIWAT